MWCKRSALHPQRLLDGLEIHVGIDDLGGLVDFDDIAQFVADLDVFHLFGHGVGVVSDNDDGHAQDFGAGQDDVVGVEVTGEDETGGTALESHELNVGTVAAHDDGCVFVLFEVGHEVFDLHGPDEEVFHDFVGLGAHRDDLAAQAVGQVSDGDGAHDGIRGDDPEHLDAVVLQEGLDHVFDLVHDVQGDVVEDHADQGIAQAFLGAHQIVIVEFLGIAVDEDGLETQHLGQGGAVHAAVLARVQEASGSAHDHDIHVLTEFFVGFTDLDDGGPAFSGKGLGFEIMCNDNRGDQGGVFVQSENFLKKEGVFVTDLFAGFARNRADRFHVTDLVAVLLEFHTQRKGDHVFSGVSSGRSYVESNHICPLCGECSGNRVW